MSRALLWTRAAVLAVTVLGAGVLSHVAADGRLPHVVALLALLGVTTGVATLFLRSRATAGRLVLLAVGGQALTHTALSLLAGHAGDSRPTAAAAVPAPGPDALVATTDASGRRTGTLLDQYAATTGSHDAAPGDPLGWLGGVVGHQVSHLLEQGPAMVLAHTLGAVALGLWLAVGETALWRLVHLGVARLDTAVRAHRVLGAALAAARDVLAARRPTLAPAACWRPTTHLPARHASRRGPPVLLPA